MRPMPLVPWNIDRLLPTGCFKRFYPLCVVACLTKDFIRFFQDPEFFFIWLYNYQK